MDARQNASRDAPIEPASGNEGKIMKRIVNVAIVGLLSIASVSVAPVSSSASDAVEAVTRLERIAVVSGVHPPHQGFALSTLVVSDDACLALAQNLASELGIQVHVMCTDAATSAITAVAECGFAMESNGPTVGSFFRGGLMQGGTQFLTCIPPTEARFPAERIVPKPGMLRPRSSGPQET